MRDWLSGNPERQSLVRVCFYMLVTRLLLGVIGYSAVRWGHPRLQYKVRDSLDHSAAIVGWLRWDVSWYLSIVDQGYTFHPNGASNVAFLPGFPVLIALFEVPLRSTIIAGLVAANASFVAAIILFWSWVRDRAGVRAAERSAVLLLAYPLSFFFNTVYAESLFFLLCTLALRSADRNQWLAAGLWTALATLTRPMGIFLVPAFAWPAIVAWRSGRLPRPSVNCCELIRSIEIQCDCS